MVFSRTSDLVTLLPLLCLVCSYRVHGFNYLVQPIGGEGSHFLVMAHLAEVLVHRGHNVTFIINSAHSYFQLDPRWGPLFEFAVYDNPYPDDAFVRTVNEFITSSYEKGATEGLLKYFSNITNALAVDCDKILSNENLIHKLKDKQFDLLLFDSSWLCSPMLADKVNLKTIMIHPAAYSGGVVGTIGVLPGLSYTPLQIEAIPRPPLSFYQRLHNVYCFVYQVAMFSVRSLPQYEAIREKHNLSLHLRVDEMIQSRLQLALMNFDHEVEVPALLTPNVIPVGGLTVSPAKQLPKELDQIMKTARQGVVVLSLGSYVNMFPRRVQEVIIESLSLLPYEVFFKFENKDNITLPPNVKALKWIPQNDLLGHEKTKVFVFQGGNNGFYEAIYHGVPMVILPLLGDQDHVAATAEERGIGVSLNIRTMTSYDLKDAIVHVMTDKKIRRNIRRFRDMYHHKPLNAKHRAAYWIEHVSKFGGMPYKPNVFHLNILQNSLLDVIVFMLAVLLSFLFFLYKSCSLLCQYTLN